MRGGTSKGVVFRAADLPPAGAARDAVIVAALGPDSTGLAIDGVGGGVTSTLKAAVVAPPSKPGFAADYHFAQVSRGGGIDWRSSCANFASAAALVAADDGMALREADGSAVVRLWASGAGEALSVTLPATDAPPVAIAGVRGEAPPLRVEFELGGHALLPTGRPEEEGLRLGDRPLRATIVDVAGNPQVLVRAVEGGLRGDEADITCEQKYSGGILLCLGGLRGDEAAEAATAALVWEAVDAAAAPHSKSPSL